MIGVGPNVNTHKLRSMAQNFMSNSIYLMDNWDDMTLLADKMFETKKSEYIPLNCNS